MEKLAAAAGPIDILLNNAGILAMSPLQEQSTEEITQLIAINLTGPILLATALAKGMIARGRGVIVNTASQLAFTGAMDRSVYSTTKAGLVQFTRTAAAEWARYGVRVVALAPGPTETPMIKEIIDTLEGRAQRLDKIPMQRFGTAEEMARLALVLASDLADNVTGHTLVADGGYVAARINDRHTQRALDVLTVACHSCTTENQHIGALRFNKFTSYRFKARTARGTFKFGNPESYRLASRIALP